MNIRKNILLLITVLFCYSFTYADESYLNTHQRLYYSYMKGNMEEWVEVIDDLKADYHRKPSEKHLFLIAQVQYGYIGYLIGKGESRSARGYLRNAEENIELFLRSKPRDADAIALKASFTAFNIALSPYKAPILGPRSIGLVDEALQLESKSVQALIEKGNISHYAPSLFGGNPRTATKYYSEAVSIIESMNGGKPPKNWLYLNVMAQLALAYEKAGMYYEARSTYKQILAIAPDFTWVRDELYPNFNKRNRLN